MELSEMHIYHEKNHVIPMGRVDSNFVINTSGGKTGRYPCDWALITLFNMHPQLYLLRLNENFRCGYFNTYPSNYYRTDDMMREVKSIMFSGSYSCILCGMNYEAFPSKMLVKLHMKSCERAKD